MKKEKKLYIEKMGCDFFYGDEINEISDMINHRYYIKDIETKDGKKIDTIEIMNGARYEEKNGKLQVKDNFKLWLNTYYYNNNGDCVRLPKIENDVNKLDLLYTKENVLKVINKISRQHYDVIEIIERY